MIKHINIIIYGDIKEISFGFQTMLAADKYNVKGKFYYLKAGNAHIEAEATQQQLDDFLKFCKKIPQAVINDIKITEGNRLFYNEFEIN